MNECEERTGLRPRSFTQTGSGIEEEEPPGKPRRHPLWRDVPDPQWNNWRWQSQNAIRSVRQLRDLLPFTPEELEAIGELEAHYKLAIPPYYFSLIDPDNPNVLLETVQKAAAAVGKRMTISLADAPS